MDARKKLLKVPVVGPTTLFAWKLKKVVDYYKGQGKIVGNWLLESRETTNFTYNITADNERYMVYLVSETLGLPFDDIYHYLLELNNDEELKEYIKMQTQANEETRLSADSDAKYARRAAWYIYTRAMKPKLVMETGIEKGLGSCVVAAALKKNHEEGYLGHYIGIDIKPGSGILFGGPYQPYGTIVIDDAIETINRLTQTIDLFISEVYFTMEYDLAELEAVSKKIDDHSILLGRNYKYMDFAMETGRKFIRFKEEASDHWFPGVGTNIVWKPK